MPREMLDDLQSYERRVYSQGGEDGVISRIFECIGTTNRFFVEFGAWDGHHLSNTANLRLHGGWSGLLLDGDGERRGDSLVKPALSPGAACAKSLIVSQPSASAWADRTVIAYVLMYPAGGSHSRSNCERYACQTC